MVLDLIPLRRRSLPIDAPSFWLFPPYFRTFRSSYFRNFYVLLLLILLLAILLSILIGILVYKWRKHPPPVFHPLKSYDNPEVLFLPSLDSLNTTFTSYRDKKWPSATSTETRCHFHSCFNVYKCGKDDHHKIKVYIYPVYDYVTAADHLPITPSPITKEYSEILSAIYFSEYYTNDPEEACIFVPSIDLLNQKRVRTSDAGRILASLPYWDGGSNHLIFNFLPGLIFEKESFPDIELGRAIVAGGSFSSWTIRRNYDISIPIPNPFARAYIRQSRNLNKKSKKWLATSSQINVHLEFRETLDKLAQDHSDFLVLDKCNDGVREESLNLTKRCQWIGGRKKEYLYPNILEKSVFCVILRGARLGQSALTDALATGCIPVVLIDHYVVPFEEVLDWQKFALKLDEVELPNLLDVLHNISPERIESMQNQVDLVWSRYFNSPGSIAITVLDIINDRTFPYISKPYSEWNDVKSFPNFISILGAPKHLGFTAVILTYDRIAALFKLVQKIASTESLTKIIVIWNNQKKRPPPSEDWPKLTKPLIVRETRANLLGNRFYPFEDIETEAVLALDDDINMLTTDELEFAYQVWSEHPDRLVGFPARLHTWDNNQTQWKYDSEWMNEISLVLTGAAFYHKHFSHLYTFAMPAKIRSWVDDHMNCEDIAMNFLIANYTGKAPIKVTPRKKFKCPNCAAVNLSYATEHMVERSDCINFFAKIYGRMPLKTVEFRADPLLFLDNVPPPMKKFSGVGSL